MSNLSLLGHNAESEIVTYGRSIVERGAPGVLVHCRVGNTSQTWTTGVGDINTGAPILVDGCWRIGCVTKLFTAVVALQLVEEGILDFDDSLFTLLPTLALPRGGAIKLRHLLSMTSGIPCYTRLDPRYSSARAALRYARLGFTPINRLRLALSAPTMFQPGARAFYSETNFLLVQMIVEHLTGQSLSEQIDKRICQKLNLSRTSLPVDSTSLSRPTARGYLGGDQHRAPFSDLRHLVDVTDWYLGGGGETDMVSTADDLSRFLQALATQELIGADTWALMQTSAITGRSIEYSNPERYAEGLPYMYGTGLAKCRLPKAVILGHDGDDVGYTTEAWMTEDGERQLVAMVNLGAPWVHSTLEDSIAHIIAAGLQPGDQSVRYEPLSYSGTDFHDR